MNTLKIASLILFGGFYVAIDLLKGNDDSTSIEKGIRAIASIASVIFNIVALAFIYQLIF